MKTHRVKQGSPEWHVLRMGIPTASQFHRIVTPKRLSLSSQANGYMCELLAARFLGVRNDEASEFMQRGTLLESKARSWYEFAREVTLDENVFCTNDEGTVGCSPDALIDDGGGLEIKCRSAAAHIGWLLGFEQAELQCQGCMWITGCKWWDFLHYHPELPPKLIRLERDDEVIHRLAEAIADFTVKLEDAEARLTKLGCRKATVAA